MNLFIFWELLAGIKKKIVTISNLGNTHGPIQVISVAFLITYFTYSGQKRRNYKIFRSHLSI